MKKDLIIIFIIFFALVIIFGLITGSKTNLNVKEYFEPEVSTNMDIESGTSSLYKWGLPKEDIIIPIGEEKSKEKKKEERCKEINKNNSIDNYYININNKTKSVPLQVNEREICKKCDITINKDIDKYVLKSSIPACPDMSEYATKSMINGKEINVNDYIHKSEIKPCPNIDMNEYIKKSEIKACPECQKCATCPVCPSCPLCPKCPPMPLVEERGTKIFNYKITDHPEIKNYIPVTKYDESKKECESKIKELDERNKKLDEEIKKLDDKFKEERVKLTEDTDKKIKDMEGRIKEKEENHSKEKSKLEKERENLINGLKSKKDDVNNENTKKINKEIMNYTDKLNGTYAGDNLYASY